MKIAKLFLLLATFGLLGLSSIETKAQAPASIAGRAVILTVSSGTYPFASTGSYLFLASATGDGTFGLVALPGGDTSNNNYGTFTYAPNGATATVKFIYDYPSITSGFVTTLTFDPGSSSTGSYFLSNPSLPFPYSQSSQNGRFSAYVGQAPASVQGWTFQLQIDGGVTPFASSGTAQIVTTVSGYGYTVTGGAGVDSSQGTYTYATYPQFSTSSSSTTLNDSKLGPVYSQTLSWTNSVSGAYVIRNTSTGGFQAGTFVVPLPVINSAPTASGTYHSVFGGYTITASGSPSSFNATGLPSGLSINTATGLISGTPTQSGTFYVSLSAYNGTTGTASLTLTVAKAPATVSLSNLATTYNGLAKAPTTTTSPSGLNVAFTYNGSATAPSAPGSYTVVGTVSDPNYQGSTTGTLVISPVSTPQTFSQWENFYSTSGASTTPRNDGIPNLLKYLYDINPSVPMTAPERAALPTLDMTTTSGTTYLTLTYHQYASLTGVTINVQTSPDLQTWTTVNPPDLSQQVGTDSGDPIMEVGVKDTGATKQFIRLNVTQP